MIEMSDDDARQAMGMLSLFSGPQTAAFMSAVVQAIFSADQGECAECSCDVCVTMRGTLLGVTNFLASQ